MRLGRKRGLKGAIGTPMNVERKPRTAKNESRKNPHRERSNVAMLAEAKRRASQYTGDFKFMLKMKNLAGSPTWIPTMKQAVAIANSIKQHPENFGT